MSRRKKWWLVALLLPLLGLAGLIALFLALRTSSLLERAIRIGDDVAEAPSGGNYSSVPLPDGRRWLRLTADDKGQTTAALHSEDAPEEPGVSVDSPPTAQSLLGVTPDHRVIATDYPQVTSGRMTFYEFGLYPNPAPLRTFSIRAPDDAEVQDIMLSPQGDRLAWKLSLRHLPPIQKFLAKYIPFWKKMEPTLGTALWVCRLNGEGMHEIGFQERKSDKATEPTFSPFRWTLDGKSLLFRYEGYRYRVPAD